jgi:hypothetical protein
MKLYFLLNQYMKTEFYLQRPTSEENEKLNAICSNMELTRNPNITPSMLTISDDFCGDPPGMQESIKLITSLRNNIETPSIYTLYLFEYFETDDDDTDEDEEDEVEIQVLAVITFAISVQNDNEINIVTLCSNQSPIGYGIKGCGLKIINFLFNAVQDYVNKINQEMYVLLTPVRHAIKFYIKMGMQLLLNGDMSRTFIPIHIEPLKINGDDDFNELAKSNNYVDIVHYITTQNPRQIINEIWKQNRKNPSVQKLFETMQTMSENGSIGPIYQKFYKVFLSKGKAKGTKKKRKRNQKQTKRRNTRKN